MNSTKQQRSIFEICERAAGIALTSAIMLVTAILATDSAQAQTYNESILHSFTGGTTDGEYPSASLLRDADGNLYGTADGGGSLQGGTVFMLDSLGNETTLYNFPSIGSPVGALVSDTQGNLYGTTWEGGAYGGGTVFKVEPNGQETVLHVFTGTDGDGYLSKAGLVIDKHGNLYGTTICGGASGSGLSGYGTVFKVDPYGNETVLHSFTGTGGDGAHPYASLVLDSKGNLYGTTYGGGYLGCQPPYGCGTVFKLDPAGNETVLYSFTGEAPDYGLNPVGGLVRDPKGNLYGTTSYGGVDSYLGNVFKLELSGRMTDLYNFTGVGGDGEYPATNLTLGAHGNLYGTTNYGGEFACPYQSGLGCGMAFKVNAIGSETILYIFAGGATGFNPSALVRDAQGNLYGTTVGGGDDACNHSYGCGTVFKLSPPVATTTELTSSPNPSTYGEAVTFIAVVAPVPPNGESISFMNGKAVLGTSTLSGGSASFVTSTLRVGTTAVKAVYGGDSSFVGSTSKAVKQLVEKAGN